MYRIYDCLAHQHDTVLVIVALLIGLGGIHTAFNLYARACIGRLHQKIAWLFLTGVVTGGAIWATHFIAMLSYDPIIPVGYEPVLTSGVPDYFDCRHHNRLCHRIGCRAAFAVIPAGWWTGCRAWHIGDAFHRHVCGTYARHH